MKHLNECLSVDDGNGIKPIRASGSRWLMHKWNAIKNMLSVYTNHIALLSVDSSVKPADRAKLKGYYQRWTDSEYLLGCAFL